MNGSSWQFLQDMNLLSVLTSILDVAIIAFVIYRLLLLIRGTRAVQLIKGIVILLVAATVADWLNLYTIQWALSNIWAVLFVALAVIFQPELRRALETLGRGKFFSATRTFLSTPESEQVVQELIKAIIAMSKTKTGMLIVLERETGLKDYIESGICLDSVVTCELLINIFEPNTPLHDGATIIKENRVAAAACFLPLSDNPYISMSLGTRHRAAIGLSEVCDAFVLVVSEETGAISVARDGKLARSLEEKELRAILEEALATKEPVHTPFWQRKGANK